MSQRCAVCRQPGCAQYGHQVLCWPCMEILQADIETPPFCAHIHSKQPSIADKICERVVLRLLEDRPYLAIRIAEALDDPDPARAQFLGETLTADDVDSLALAIDAATRELGLTWEVA